MYFCIYGKKSYWKKINEEKGHEKIFKKAEWKCLSSKIPMSWIVIMLGWFSEAIIFPSLMNRSDCSGVSNLFSIFNATFRWSDFCVARYIAAIPPSAIKLSILYPGIFKITCSYKSVTFWCHFMNWAFVLRIVIGSIFLNFKGLILSYFIVLIHGFLISHKEKPRLGGADTVNTMRQERG